MVWIVALLAGWVQQGPANRPQDGPWNHQVHFATSPDGLRWTEQRRPLLTQASVPELMELPADSPAGRAGTLFCYCVVMPGREAVDRTSRLVSTDGGATWSGPVDLSVVGNDLAGTAVDPSVMVLPDGRLRLYFYDMVRGPHHEQHRILSAVSRDGLRFEQELGVRYQQGPQVTDPEVVQCGPTWLMFLASPESVLLARSTDGLGFTRDPDFRLPGGGIPGALPLPDGAVRLYGNGPGGIVSRQYDPVTGRLGQEATPVLPGPAADPSVIRRADGSYAMVLKRWMRHRGPVRPQ